MFVKSYCSSISGIEAVTVAVEVNITAGIGMYLVGLPDNAVRESRSASAPHSKTANIK